MRISTLLLASSLAILGFAASAETDSKKVDAIFGRAHTEADGAYTGSLKNSVPGQFRGGGRSAPPAF